MKFLTTFDLFLKQNIFNNKLHEMKSKTQKVLSHLIEKKSITSLEAFKLYKLTRLAAIIFKFRQEGYEIKSQSISVKDKHTEKNTTFTKYVFISKPKIKK